MEKKRLGSAMKVRFTFTFDAMVRRDAMAGVWVSSCSALDLFTQGETRDEAKRALKSIAPRFVAACYARKVFFSLLANRGFALKRPGRLKAKRQQDAHAFKLRVPLLLTAQG